jgi:hypothetical protein
MSQGVYHCLQDSRDRTSERRGLKGGSVPRPASPRGGMEVCRALVLRYDVLKLPPEVQ